jgi:protein-S-isoprenylcysteine O-methyltransferase Ste14
MVALFATAGSMSWLWGWVVTIVMLLGNILGTLFISSELMDERIGIKSGHKSNDILLAIIVGRLGPLSIVITAGLDYRFGWSPSFPIALNILGLVFLVVGFVLVFLAMRENKFFSSVVRIQKERDHQVISSGPYRFVRHPGYAGAIIYLLALPFIITSWWALIPSIVTIVITVIRTSLEDNLLTKELPDYAGYTKQVRYRLLPRVW